MLEFDEQPVKWCKTVVMLVGIPFGDKIAVVRSDDPMAQYPVGHLRREETVRLTCL